MSQYPVLKAAGASTYLRARAAGDDIPLENIVEHSGTGDVFDAAPITELATKLRALRKKFPPKLKEKDTEGGRFEREACEIVHSTLAAIDREALADLDFWTFLAIVHFSDVIEWRFGAIWRTAKAANYGVGQRTENMMFRLWLRAELGRDVGPDPYRLAKTGDQDLWRSHILRQGYANARAVAKSLLRLQAGQLQAGGQTVKKLTVDHVRELAKRLKRLRANVMFEFLTAAQAETLVLELSTAIKKGK
jgi:hypothetical protein